MSTEIAKLEHLTGQVVYGVLNDYLWEDGVPPPQEPHNGETPVVAVKYRGHRHSGDPVFGEVGFFDLVYRDPRTAKEYIFEGKLIDCLASFVESYNRSYGKEVPFRKAWHALSAILYHAGLNPVTGTPVINERGDTVGEKAPPAGVPSAAKVTLSERTLSLKEVIDLTPFGVTRIGRIRRWLTHLALKLLVPR